MHHKMVNGKWVSESFGNRLFDTIHLMQFMSEQTDAKFLQCAMKVCRQNLEPILRELDSRELKDEFARMETVEKIEIQRLACEGCESDRD